MASNAAVEGLSGAIGGVLALTVTYPLMTISTLQATRQKPTEIPSEELTKPVKTRTGTLADFAEVIASSGWTGIYRGYFPALIGTAASQGVYFYLYSWLREQAVTRKRLLSVGKPLELARAEEISAGTSLLLAFIAGCGNVLATNPIWVVSTRMQARQKGGESRGMLSVAREVYSDYGIKGFWKGVLPSLLMVINPSIQYMFFEDLIKRLNEWRRTVAKTSGGRVPMRKPSALEIFMVSALAKLGATVITYPMLLVKTRQMSTAKDTHADRQYRGTVDAILRIWSEEGFTGFYKGMRAKIVQSVLAAALLFAIKEELAGTSRRLLQAVPVAAKPPVAGSVALAVVR